MGCVKETWYHGVWGGDLVPWGVWRRLGAVGCVEEIRPGAIHGVCGDLVQWGVCRATNVPVPWPSHTLWYCMPPKVPTIHVCWLRSLLSKKKVRRVREGVPLPLT